MRVVVAARAADRADRDFGQRAQGVVAIGGADRRAVDVIGRQVGVGRSVRRWSNV